MAFDQNDNRPIIDPKKKTTKVNLFMVFGVVLFLGLCVGGIWYFRRVERTFADVI